MTYDEELAVDAIRQAIVEKDREIERLRKGLQVFADPTSFKTVQQYQDDALPFVWDDPWIHAEPTPDDPWRERRCIDNPAAFAREILDGKETP